MAIASLVLGILSVVSMLNGTIVTTVVMGILAIVFGISSVKKMKVMAITGIINATILLNPVLPRPMKRPKTIHAAHCQGSKS